MIRILSVVAALGLRCAGDRAAEVPAVADPQNTLFIDTNLRPHHHQAAQDPRPSMPSA